MKRRISKDEAAHRAWLLRELPAWEESGWLAPGGRTAIEEQYGDLPDPAERRRELLLTLIAIIGGGFVGLGLILLLAYNWNELSRPLRAVIALALPAASHGAGIALLAGQTWAQRFREVIALLMCVTVPAAVALIGQTYHFGGEPADVLFVGVVAGLPVLYLFRGLGAWGAWLLGATWWGWLEMDGLRTPFAGWLAAILLAAPAGVLLFRARTAAAARTLVVQFAVLAVTFGLPTLLGGSHGWVPFLAYLGWFGSLAAVSSLGGGQAIHGRTVAGFGSLGLLVLLLVGGFDEVWSELIRGRASWGRQPWISVTTAVSLGILPTLAAVRALLRKDWVNGIWWVTPLAGWIGIVTVAGSGSDAGLLATQLGMNALALAAGVLWIVDGVRDNRLGSLNLGMLLVSLTALFRFFDAGLGMVERGLAFILLGSAFIAINVRVGRRRKGGGDA